MIINILYLIVGSLIGMLIKYQIDFSHSQKKMKNKISTYNNMRNCTDSKLQQCDEILQSIRAVNENLQILQKEKGV